MMALLPQHGPAVTPHHQHPRGPKVRRDIALLPKVPALIGKTERVRMCCGRPMTLAFWSGLPQIVKRWGCFGCEADNYAYALDGTTGMCA